MQRWTYGIVELGFASILCLGIILAACSKNSESTDKGKSAAVMSNDHEKDDRGNDGNISEGRNRLALEKSPYLLQHADNPVDWYPWGQEAFERAKREDKPIFLSIGYSTCHWCHVMEHESFEDATVAAMMNDTFVNIKVDREERPDIDSIYMTVCQMMTGSGGWPLTILMTPERKPFFAATYIPKENRFGRAGMMELIPQVREAWLTRRNELDEASERLTEHLREFSESKSGEARELTTEILDACHAQLAARFDEGHGGFGGAPKFPTPHNLLFLLRHWKRTGDEKALEMVRKTLHNMSQGGIYDHVGFGFHRYSTDARWFAPHFEKMLYDQALLVMAYTEANLATDDPEYRRVVEEILTYVFRDMTDPAGGFYSAEDADSEGTEGKFYLWTESELRRVLGKDDADFVIDIYGVETAGNFNEELEGGNILYLRRSISTVAGELGASEEEVRKRLEAIRVRLFEAREKRVHPSKDDKILTDWNGLMIAAVAMAGRVFDERRYVERAEEASRFIVETMRDSKGRLCHRYRDGEVGIQANLDDYAFLVWGLIELYEATFDAQHLRLALELNREMVERFWDSKGGGFFFTPNDGEELIVRMKEFSDTAVPSGNSAAMLNLVRLGRITADAELERYAAQVGSAFREDLDRAPSAATLMLSALSFGVGPSFEIIIVGDPDAADTRKIQQALNRTYLPNKVVLLKSSDDPDAITNLAAYTEPHQAIDGKATVYVCRNYACDLPTTDADEMLVLLEKP